MRAAWLEGRTGGLAPGGPRSWEPCRRQEVVAGVPTSYLRSRGAMEGELRIVRTKRNLPGSRTRVGKGMTPGSVGLPTREVGVAGRAVWAVTGRRALGGPAGPGL